MLEALLQPAPLPATGPGQSGEAASAAVGRLAIQSLYREVALSPKPGLVSPMDNGSHQDMDFRTFVRSLSALRSYFPVIVACGAQSPAFAQLQALGIEAEARMLASTGGINTHRGAIFNLGLLCAAAGLLAARGQSWSAEAACEVVTASWGPDILAGLIGRDMGESHGLTVARRYGSGGARQEAASGFPAALHLGLPAYRAALAATGCRERAAVQALFALMAEVEDTNLLWRGGREGLRYGQQAAADFLEKGGVHALDWHERALTVHREFVWRGLSPGGSADLLGVSLFLDALDHTNTPCA